ncbi:hypothetical protein [Robertmurraya sp. Marseille-Q9965]
MSEEVNTFEGIPDWYVRVKIPAQECIVVANDDEDFEAASKVVEDYVEALAFHLSAEGRDYLICERYNYTGEGFARYSLLIV